MDKRKPTITVPLDIGIRNRLINDAASMDRSVSWLVRAIVDSHYKNEDYIMRTQQKTFSLDES